MRFFLRFNIFPSFSIFCDGSVRLEHFHKEIRTENLLMLKTMTQKLYKVHEMRMILNWALVLISDLSIKLKLCCSWHRLNISSFQWPLSVNIIWCWALLTKLIEKMWWSNANNWPKVHHFNSIKVIVSMHKWLWPKV